MPRRTLEWNTADDFNQATRDGSLAVLSEGAVQLANRIVLADEMGRCNSRDVERLSGNTWAKKIFVIEDPGSGEATLGIYMRCVDENEEKTTGTLLVDVNGDTITVPFPEDRPYWEDSWRRVPVPSGVIRRGINEVVLRAVNGGTFLLLVENCIQPNRSAKSRDGGRTWDFDNLAYNDAYDGEYLVRLEIKGHPSSGAITSPAIDLAQAFSKKSAGARFHLEKVGLRADAYKPKGTKLSLECRLGNVPDPESENWTQWKPTNSLASDDLLDARFIQWRAFLSTNDTDTTPVLKGLKLILNGQIEKPHTSIRVLDENNPSIIRSSYRFAHQRAGDKRSNVLRERWKLDSVVAPANTEFEKFLLLRQWVRDQWVDGWNRGALQFVPPWDTLLILELTKRELSLGMCTHYATVMTHCCAAIGLVARTVVMRCHCINEVWSNDYGKWVAMDIGGDPNDFRRSTFHFEKDGIPLSFLEAHRAWLKKDFESVNFSPASTAKAFKIEDRLELFERFMIHLRNDELTSLEPGEPEHGAGSYQYNRFLFWEDDETPPLPWFSRHSCRESDFWWSMNRAHIHLREGEEESQMDVQLDHCTPNFSHFEVRKDGAEWERVESSFTWIPAPGSHTLHARTKNLFGHPGIESSIRFKIKPTASVKASPDRAIETAAV